MNLSVDEISFLLSDTYSTKDTFTYIIYEFKKLPIRLFTDKKNTVNASLSIDFYDSDTKIHLINSFIFDGIQLTRNMDFDEIEEKLYKKNIDYEIIEYARYIKIKTKEHDLLSIIFLKEDLSKPFRVQVRFSSYPSYKLGNEYFTTFKGNFLNIIQPEEVSYRHLHSRIQAGVPRAKLQEIIKNHEAVLYYYSSEIYSNDLLTDISVLYIGDDKDLISSDLKLSESFLLLEDSAIIDLYSNECHIIHTKEDFY